MSHHAQEKVNEVLMRLAGEFLVRNANLESLITVTRAEASPEGNRVILYVSVLPDTMSEKAIKFLKRERSEFRDYVLNNSRLQHPPTIDFVYDIGEKNRQRIFELTVTKPAIPDATAQATAPVSVPPTKKKTVSKKKKSS